MGGGAKAQGKWAARDSTSHRPPSTWYSPLCTAYRAPRTVYCLPPTSTASAKASAELQTEHDFLGIEVCREISALIRAFWIDAPSRSGDACRSRGSRRRGGRRRGG